MLRITQDLLTSQRNRPYLRDEKHYAIRQLKGVVAHWTANLSKGAHAKANRNYFNNTQRFASAHYIVDDHSIIQCIPDNEVGYHVGGSSYRPDGARIKESSGLTPNYFLIGFEMCVNADGDWDKTYRNAVDLAAHLLRKYRFSIHDLYRHYDITGKDCPRMMINELEWSSFKRHIGTAMVDLNPPVLAQGAVLSAGLNVRSGPSVHNPVKSQLKRNDQVSIYETRDGWHRIGVQRWVSARYINITRQTRLAEISEATGANIRSGPGMSHPVVDALPHGALADIFDESGSWFNIGTDRWAHSSLFKILTRRAGTVHGTAWLNVRKGPGVTHPIIHRLAEQEQVMVIETSDNWHRIGTNEWVYANFIQMEA